MSHDWFMERVGRSILWEYQPEQWREEFVKDAEAAKKLHTMSLAGETFADVIPSANVCVACEG